MTTCRRHTAVGLRICRWPKPALVENSCDPAALGLNSAAACTTSLDGLHEPRDQTRARPVHGAHQGGPEGTGSVGRPGRGDRGRGPSTRNAPGAGDAADLTAGGEPVRPVDDRAVAGAAPVRRHLLRPLVGRVHRVRPARPRSGCTPTACRTRRCAPSIDSARLELVGTVEDEHLVEACRSGVPSALAPLSPMM